MKKVIIIVYAALLVALFCQQIQAEIINYTVGGAIHHERTNLDSSYTEFLSDISGEMSISDQKNYIYGPDWGVFFDITNFSITVDEYQFYGTGRITYTWSDTYLSLIGEGDWSSWHFNADEGDLHFPPYDEFQMPEYSYFVDHDCIDGISHYGPNSPILYGDNIWAYARVEISYVPIPEPSTWLLLSIGVLLLHEYRRFSISLTASCPCQTIS